MTRRYANIIARFNETANAIYAECELFKATAEQEQMYIDVHNALFSVFGLVSAVIRSSEYTEEEKAAVCKHICEQLDAIDTHRTAIKDALEQMEVTLRYPRIQAGKRVQNAIENYRLFE